MRNRLQRPPNCFTTSAVWWQQAELNKRLVNLTQAWQNQTTLPLCEGSVLKKGWTLLGEHKAWSVQLSDRFWFFFPQSNSRELCLGQMLWEVSHTFDASRKTLKSLECCFLFNTNAAWRWKKKKPVRQVESVMDRCRFVVTWVCSSEWKNTIKISPLQWTMIAFAWKWIKGPFSDMPLGGS